MRDQSATRHDGRCGTFFIWITTPLDVTLENPGLETLTLGGDECPKLVNRNLAYGRLHPGVLVSSTFLQPAALPPAHQGPIPSTQSLGVREPSVPQE